MKKWVKTIGYITLLTSMILWLAIAIVPFLGYSKGQVAGIITGLIIAGEITFYLAIALLGKTIYNAIKHRFMFWKPKPGEPKPVEVHEEDETVKRSE
jgi:hypothetical protein